MESQSSFSSAYVDGAAFPAFSSTYMPIEPEQKNKVERLPFSIRVAKNEEDILKAVSIRYSAYVRHVPSIAAQFKRPEPADFYDGAVVFLAESKLDGRPLGSVRVQTNQFRPLALESSVTLPDKFKGATLAEGTRLSATDEKIGRLVSTLLSKAYVMHCLNTGIDWMVLTGRSPMDKLYASLMLEDVFPERGYIPMSHVGNIPHRVMSQDMATMKERWANANHPLYDLYFRVNHPDIDVGHVNHLPQFLHDFEYTRSQVRNVRVS
jgi:hypothetical protein